MLIPIILLWMILIGLFWWNNNENDLYYWEYSDFTNHFSQDLIDTPLWIPVERGRITYGFDYTYWWNQHPLNEKYLSLTLPGSTKYYTKHQWLDFAPLWLDKLKFYSPKIISTLDGIILQYETFTQEGNMNNYTRVAYVNNTYITIEHQWRANRIIEERPYWNHVIVSSKDWVFYVMFAHLESINAALIEWGDIKRWQVIWIEWSTWNSTAQHLHYEIRYCWENTELKKWWRDCKPINPLSFVAWQDFTYLWFKELPKENKFTAWDKDISEVIQEDNSEEIKTKKESFCNKVLLLNTNCDILYPISEFSKNNVLFPPVQEWERESIAKQYIFQEYWWETNLQTIAKLEWIIFQPKTFYSDLWKTLSYGKYKNKENVYKIKNTSLLKQEEKDNIEKTMLDDLVKRINKKNSAAEEFFRKYYQASQYKEGKNPYIYNFIDSSSVFLEILDPSGKSLWKFNQDWVLTIYNKSK